MTRNRAPGKKNDSGTNAVNAEPVAKVPHAHDGDTSVVNVRTDPKTSAQSTENKQKKTADAQLEPTRYGDWEKAGRCIDF